MKLRSFVLATAIVGLLAGVTACGGSGGSDASQVSQVISGPITAFGSVYVNGARYNTDNATVYVENSKGHESDLRVGMMVRVEASANGAAKTIHFTDDLEGFVISSNITVDGTGTATGTMDVMGQTVTVDADTIFESDVATIATAADIVKGNIVEVTGYSMANGAITATRVEVKAADLATYLQTHDSIEVKGVVASHDAANSTFTIGGLTILYDGANLDDMPAGKWDGLFVEVKSASIPNADAQLAAAKVELENGGSKVNHVKEDEEVEVYGQVSAVTADAVTINGQTFLLDADTGYEHGSKAELVEGVMVKAEGYVNSNGDLVAEKIEFNEYKNSIKEEIEGAVTSIDMTDTNVGTIVVNGATIHINNTTIMHDDKGMTPDTHFNLSELVSGDYVEVQLVPNADGTYAAIKLEREEAM